MSSGPRAFQQATIRVALKALTREGSPRRFLVADEPGLGKTVVARGLLEEMSSHRAEPLRVFYVCSNQAIARQNLGELVRFLPDEEQETALANVDRPSLLPVGKSPASRRVNVYSLTPGTALPGRGGGSSRGRVEERALIYVLLTMLLGTHVNGLRTMLRSGVDPANFKGWIDRYRWKFKEKKLRIDSFMPLWQAELKQALSLPNHGSLLDGIADAIARDAKTSPGILIAGLRASVACAALSSVKPDIVIFDEFQRFRDLLDDRSETPEAESDAISHRVLSAVLGDHPAYAPALLLLSATPYTPYRSRQGVGSEATLTDDFFELISFLSGGGPLGDDAADKARELFQVLEEELVKGTQLSVRAKEARLGLQELLSRLLSRTERSLAASTDDELLVSMNPIESPLLPEDLAAFSHLATSLEAGADRAWAVPFWQSVPLPMQTLGNRYKSWRRARNRTAESKIGLAKTDRDQYQSLAPWPHPRLRSLFRAMPISQLSLPWVRPSVPWWPLAGPWAGRQAESEVDGKALVFSQFLAVPTALAGLMSYAVEAKWARRRKAGNEDAYLAATDQSRLEARADRPSLLELFHPSPLLASLEPLANGTRSVMGVKAAIQAQLRKQLKEAGIHVAKDGAQNRKVLKPWQLVPMLEKRLGAWGVSHAAWASIAQETSRATKDTPGEREAGGTLQAVLDKWNEAAQESVEQIDDDQEFNQLVDLAIDSPGVVFARAVTRHWPEALAGYDNRKLLAGIAWRGFRSYFDTPWFVALLEGGRGAGYPAALRQAVVDGNLESVLDEHLWYLSTKAGSWTKRLQELEKTLRIRNSRIVLHELGRSEETFTLRCHAAVGLTEARVRSQIPEAPGEEDAELPDRPEDVRKAFNSPFWPHVLVTTSVGQEGLDFHPWCCTLLHWDLCGGPIDLEQREGRINRYAGLSIRRAIANQLAGKLNFRGRNTSLWCELARLADEQLSDHTGLSPWWVAPGAEIKRFFFEIPGSELQFRAASVARERALYRLVLGMPDQADLLEHVAANMKCDAGALREACLDLAAINFDRT